jgi:hypothetical protein
LARRLAELILVSSFAESNQLLPSTALLFILVNELTVLQELFSATRLKPSKRLV